MAAMRLRDRLLLLFFLVVILPLGVYGIYAGYRETAETHPVIVKTLIEPYADALRAGDCAKAYHNHTSSKFRKAYSMDAYVQGHKANFDEFGPLETIAIRENEAFQAANNLFSWRKYYHGGLTYRYRKAEVWVGWEIVEEDGAFKIDDTFQAFHERWDPRVF
ncbi:MAG TPA: hypothetical protein PK250_06210 [Syntrophobacter fumaroxidans]|nr:hypothetical protein [Syntrophobacter fumaroxidans]